MVHSRSINNTVYNVVTLGCVYFTGVDLLMDKIVHRHELAYAVKKFDLFTAFTVVGCPSWSADVFFSFSAVL
jgi:hypothetical protein